MTCDQVFDILTRGPFPSGAASDGDVERHLAACHQCRELAEALRPAAGLFHEVMASEDESALPAYQGLLAEPDGGNELKGAAMNAVVGAEPSESHGLGGYKKPRSRLSSDVSSFWKVALAVAVGVLFGASLHAAAGKSWMGISQGAAENPASALAAPLTNNTAPVSLTRDAGRLLVSFQLPNVCVVSRESSSHESTGGDPQRHGAVCCTECHFAKRGPKSAVSVSGILLASCQACHGR